MGRENNSCGTQGTQDELFSVYYRFIHGKPLLTEKELHSLWANIAQGNCVTFAFLLIFNYLPSVAHLHLRHYTIRPGTSADSSLIITPLVPYLRVQRLPLCTPFPGAFNDLAIQWIPDDGTLPSDFWGETPAEPSIPSAAAAC